MPVVRALALGRNLIEHHDLGVRAACGGHGRKADCSKLPRERDQLVGGHVLIAKENDTVLKKSCFYNRSLVLRQRRA